jgi:hypothetical protein
MKSICINLDSRKDRWYKTELLLINRGFNIKRYSAHKRTPGWAGCTESHLGALKQMGEPPFIIFEDDIEFVAPIKVLYDAIDQIKTFDMIFLGCDPMEPMYQITENVLKIGKVFQTHAIAYGSSRVIEFILSNKNDIRKIDVFFAAFVIPQFDCYATYPMIVKQTDGKSDIMDCPAKFDYIYDKFESMVIKK